MAMVTIGQTTALIPEAGSAVQPEWLNDGQSGNTNFPYSSYKALATVGEVDADTKLGLPATPTDRLPGCRTTTPSVLLISLSLTLISTAALLPLRPTLRK